MCGRVIQSSAPIRHGIVDGMNVRDSRVHNYPPRWNGAPSQGLLVIRRNHQTGEVSLDPLRWGGVRTPRADENRLNSGSFQFSHSPPMPNGLPSFMAMAWAAYLSDP
jgi:putative SOS response-associated peptidase YedK